MQFLKPTLLLAALLVSTITQASPTKVIILNKQNTLSLNSEVSYDSVASLIVKARELDAKRVYFDSLVAPIYLFLNTPGGDVQAGLELIEALRGLNRPVHTITMFSASMGFQIAQNLNDRYILKTGVLMSHRARGVFQGEFGGTFPDQVASRYGIWASRVREMDLQTVARSKGKYTLESYLKAYSPELWVTGTQAVKLGLADEVAAVHCDDTLSGTETHKVTFGGIPISYETDKCPLNTGIMDVKINIPTNKGVMPYEEFIAVGGSFNPECLVISSSDSSKVCALNTSLNHERLRELRHQLSDTLFKNKMNPIPLDTGF